MTKRVAIIHDWLNGMRGGEKVLEEILEHFPAAEIFTLFYEPEKISERIRRHPVHASRLNRNSLARKKYQYFLSSFPALVEEFDLSGFDLVISSSHCVAKGAIPPPHAPHICYLHSPMRYAWDQYQSYFGHYPGLLRRQISKKVSALRTWDVAASQRVDFFLANSGFVRQRIAKYYRREAEVLHPPIDTEFFTPGQEPRGEFCLAVAALVPYKRLEIVIRACNESGRPLLIVGRGPEAGRLKKIAGRHVTFRSGLTAGELLDLYRRARYLVFAGIEDFGMAFAEAAACGTPVVAFDRGGVKDIVIPAKSGLLFAEQSPRALVKALEEADRIAFQPQDVRSCALPFSVSRFHEKFAGYLEKFNP